MGVVAVAAVVVPFDGDFVALDIDDVLVVCGVVVDEASCCSVTLMLAVDFGDFCWSSLFVVTMAAVVWRATDVCTAAIEVVTVDNTEAEPVAENAVVASSPPSVVAMPLPPASPSSMSLFW